MFALRFTGRVVLSGTVPRLAVLALLPLVSLRAQGTAGARYRVTSSAVLSLDRAPQPALVDTVETTSLLTIAVSSGNTATLSLDSLAVMSTGMIRRAPEAFSHGISVSAVLTDGRPLVTGDSASACASERPLAGLLPDLLPLLPTPLRAEQQWSDTLTVTTCRAGLPITTVTIAAYRTLTGMDSTSLLLERRAVIRAAGTAVLRAQTVVLTGSGTSESLAVVALASRRIQSLRGSQTLELQLTNGTQTRRIVQQITDTVALIQ